MLLGKPEIERRIAVGDIVIDEFRPENLGTAQYDVTLGEHFFRENAARPMVSRVYNPFSERHVRTKWILDRPVTHEEYIERFGAPLENVGSKAKLILLGPGEIILGHTEEYIGGRSNDITTMMKARSSLGRNCVEIARCAGMGDVGYFNRWTLEICNTSRVDTIALPVGIRVGQLLFFRVDPVDEKDMYSKAGKYQASMSIDEVKRAWTPDALLPKQWRDRECSK